MSLASEIESLFATIREKVGGFPAAMEDHIERIIGLHKEPEAELVVEPVEPEVAEAIATMSAPVETEAPAA